jgi:hypothetical protein
MSKKETVFTPLSFPNYDDLTYKQLRFLLATNERPSVGAFAEVLRGTLSRQDKKQFDAMRNADLHNLIESYVEFNATREDLLSERWDDDGF